MGGADAAVSGVNVRSRGLSLPVHDAMKPHFLISVENGRDEIRFLLRGTVRAPVQFEWALCVSSSNASLQPWQEDSSLPNRSSAC